MSGADKDALKMPTSASSSPSLQNSAQKMFLARAPAAWAACRRGDEVPPLPLRVRFDVSSRCNLRCPRCPQKKLSAEQKQDLPFELFARAAAELAAFRPRLNLHHRGESLLNPEFPRFLRLALQNGLYCRLHTNGTLLDKHLGRALPTAAAEASAETGRRPGALLELSISLDAWNAADYAAARPGGNFEEVLRRTAEFVARRKKLKKRRPRLTLQFITGKPLNRTARREIRALAARLRLERRDRVLLKPPHDWAGNVTLPLAAAAGKASAKQTTEDETAPGGGCVFPWYDLSVLSDGRVSACPQDYFGELTLGDLNEQTIAEIWNGEEAKALRRAHAADRRGDHSLLPPLCRRCAFRRRKLLLGLPRGRFRPFMRELFLR